jgi:hypothetical protein
MKELKDLDYVVAAQMIGCEIGTIKAVRMVEAPKGGFLPNGKPVILFEAHLFSAATGRQYDLTHPDISSMKWNRKLYVGGAGEWVRLNLAIELNRSAALQSASWGMFQILGSNYKACGFATVDDFVNAMAESEKAQLMAFVKFIKMRGLDDELRNKNWAKFALHYNGPRYAENNYDVKLQTAYQKLKA